MKVIVPYTDIVPGLELALLMDRVPALYVRMEDDLNYWYVLRELWQERETFILVEHDVIPWPGALKLLWDCPEPWCANPYKLAHDNGFTTALGCTKFDKSLMEKVPELWDRLAEGIDFRCQGDPRHWYGLDGRLGLVLSSTVGMAWPHRHEPPVTHLNPRHM